MTYLKAVTKNKIIYSLFSNGTACVGDIQLTKVPSAVDSCDSIKGTTIDIPPSIEGDDKSYTVISFHAFSFHQCQEIKVSLPNTIRYLGQSAFDLCRMNDEIKLPESLEVIGPFALASNNYQSIAIPKNVKVIGNAFASYCSIKSISLDSQNTFFKLDSYGVLYDAGFTKLLLAPQDLTNISIPDTVNEIYTAALGFLQLTELIIPASVKILHTPLIFYAPTFKNLYILGNVEYPDKSSPISNTNTIHNFNYMGTKAITNDIFGDFKPNHITVCSGYKGTNVGTITDFNINPYCASYPLLYPCPTISFHIRFHISYFLYTIVFH